MLLQDCHLVTSKSQLRAGVPPSYPSQRGDTVASPHSGLAAPGLSALGVVGAGQGRADTPTSDTSLLTLPPALPPNADMVSEPEKTPGSLAADPTAQSRYDCRGGPARGQARTTHRPARMINSRGKEGHGWCFPVPSPAFSPEGDRMSPPSVPHDTWTRNPVSCSGLVLNPALTFTIGEVNITKTDPQNMKYPFSPLLKSKFHS